MVRIVEIIALGAVAIAAGVGGFKLRELFGNLTGENITTGITDTLEGVGGGVQDFFGGISLPNPFQSQQSNQPPIVLGPIQENFDSPLLPTEAERVAGNNAILQQIGAPPQGPVNIPGVITPPNIAAIVPQVNAPEPPINTNPNFGQIPGSGFVGGQINETPIGNLSLGQIIDRFNVTASQAANIQALAQNNFGDFDFGTNTGSGIGSISTNPDINPDVIRGNVSNPEFSGLTATEIAQRLTGGNISNF